MQVLSNRQEIEITNIGVEESEVSNKLFKYGSLKPQVNRHQKNFCS